MRGCIAIQRHVARSGVGTAIHIRVQAHESHGGVGYADSIAVHRLVAVSCVLMRYSI